MSISQGYFNRRKQSNILIDKIILYCILKSKSTRCILNDRKIEFVSNVYNNILNYIIKYR